MNKEQILKIANDNNGYLYSDIIKDNNISTAYICRLVEDKELSKVARGIYITKKGIEDEHYINQLLYSRIIYSGQTALFLNGLSNKRYFDKEVVVPYGSTVPKIKGYKVIVSRKDTFDLGETLVKTTFGNKVRCYDKERCICDLFIRPDNYDYEDRVFAINEYKNNYLNIKKLYEYAKKLKVYDDIKNVFEVIVWN